MVNQNFGRHYGANNPEKPKPKPKPKEKEKERGSGARTQAGKKKAATKKQPAGKRSRNKTTSRK